MAFLAPCPKCEHELGIVGILGLSSAIRCGRCGVRLVRDTTGTETILSNLVIFGWMPALLLFMLNERDLFILYIVGGLLGLVFILWMVQILEPYSRDDKR